MTIEAWGDRIAPDIPETLRRFPLPVIFAGLATLTILAINNGLMDRGDETWWRLAAGSGSAAVFAVAGVFFRESRPANRAAGVLLALVVPVAAALLCQVRDTVLFVPYALPVIGALWLSVSAFTLGWRGEVARYQQDRFWWLNHRAVASGAIGGVALLVVSLGLLAIERTLAILFGFNIGDLFYRTILPSLLCFFAPIYWLSTLPQLADYDERVLDRPDFLARAVGLLGKFVLIPLLLAYGLILLAYVGQIAITMQLPQGVLGWMVMGFVIAGAGTWLVVHPPFARTSRIVRFFRATWFWLTLLPLALFFVAVFQRVDAYGLTEERVLLGWGGVWASLLALAFLLGRDDIRFIPGLAAICLLFATSGPWNLENLPRWQQGMALDLMLSSAGPSGESAGVRPDWTREQAARAAGAINYLGESDAGRRELERVLVLHGFGLDAGGISAPTAIDILGLTNPALVGQPVHVSLRRDFKTPVDVSATPWFLGKVQVPWSSAATPSVDFALQIEGQRLRVMRNGAEAASADLNPLIAGNGGTALAQSAIDFDLDGRRFRLVADLVSVTKAADESGGNPAVDYIEGALFSSSTAD
jgi:hypothetical protein